MRSILLWVIAMDLTPAKWQPPHGVCAATVSQMPCGVGSWAKSIGVMPGCE